MWVALLPLEAVDVGGGLARGRMIGSVGLGGRVGLVGCRVEWGWQWWSGLPTGILPAGQLLELRWEGVVSAYL